MKTKARLLGITEFPYRETDKNGRVTYYEDSNGDWRMSEFDNKGRRTYAEWYYGYWYKIKYFDNTNESYFEDDDFKEFSIR